MLIQLSQLFALPAHDLPDEHGLRRPGLPARFSRIWLRVARQSTPIHHWLQHRRPGQAQLG